MNYTQADVDRILEASEKATNGEWEAGEGQLDGGYIGVFPKGKMGVSPICRISPLGKMTEEDVFNAEFIAGAPILAEEIKRLRAEVEKLHLDLVYLRREYTGDMIDRSL